MSNQIIDVVAGVIHKQNEILLCRRKEGKQHAGFWEFPGGKQEIGESREFALHREIREELGIEITVQRFITNSIFHYPTISICLWAYKCIYESGIISLTDHDKTEWVSPHKISNFSLSPADVEIAKKIPRPVR